MSPVPVEKPKNLATSKKTTPAPTLSSQVSVKAVRWVRHDALRLKWKSVGVIIIRKVTAVTDETAKKGRTKLRHETRHG